MIAHTLASQDTDATAARKANCRAQNHIKATRLDQVNIAKNQWRDVAERRLLALLPWMERASRVTKGSGGLVRCHHPHTITCLSTLQVHAEASLQRAHGDVFDAVTSMIRNWRIRAWFSLQWPILRVLAGSSSSDGTRAKEDVSGGNLQLWNLWRGLVLTHACQCALPFATCAVPYCTLARALVLASEDPQAENHFVPI